jgi:hypothetical protein
MQHNNRFAMRVATDFPIYLISIADIEEALLERLNFRKQFAHGFAFPIGRTNNKLT